MPQPNGSPRLRTRKGLLLIAFGGLLYTLDLPLLRLSLAKSSDMAFGRGAFLFISLTVIWAITRWWQGNRKPFIAGVEGLSVIVTIAMSSLCYVEAVAGTNAANVVFITALIPLITAIFSHVFVGERVHAITWLAALVAFFSVAAIVWNGINVGYWYGDLMALFAAFFTSTTFTIIRASGKDMTASLALGSLASAMAAWLFFGAAPLALLAPSSFGFPAWVWLALNGLLAIPIASVLFAAGPRYLPSTDVSMFFLLETVLTPILAWFIFGETPGLVVLISGAVLIITLAIHSLWRLNVQFDVRMTRSSGQSAT